MLLFKHRLKGYCWWLIVLILRPGLINESEVLDALDRNEWRTITEITTIVHNKRGGPKRLLLGTRHEVNRNLHRLHAQQLVILGFNSDENPIFKLNDSGVHRRINPRVKQKLLWVDLEPSFSKAG